jgi:hypothetical protein
MGRKGTKDDFNANFRPVLSSKRARHFRIKTFYDQEKKNKSGRPKEGLAQRRTGRLTVSRKRIRNRNRGTRIRGRRWRGPVATVNYRLAHSPTRQRGRPIIINPKLYKDFKAKEKFVMAPNGGLTPEQTGRLTISSKITLNFTKTPLS